jgi:hypothetical protein
LLPEAAILGSKDHPLFAVVRPEVVRPEILNERVEDKAGTVVSDDGGDEGFELLDITLIPEAADLSDGSYIVKFEKDEILVRF